MKQIVFCREGEAVSDFQIINKVDEFVREFEPINEIIEWKVSNALIITYFRVLIKEGIISIDNYQFYIEDIDGTIHYFHIDKDGRSPNWKDSLCVEEKLMRRLL